MLQLVMEKSFLAGLLTLVLMVGTAPGPMAHISLADDVCAIAVAKGVKASLLRLDSDTLVFILYGPWEIYGYQVVEDGWLVFIAAGPHSPEPCDSGAGGNCSVQLPGGAGGSRRSWDLVEDPYEMASKMIAHIDERRAALGLDKKKERVLMDMSDRQALDAA